MFSAAAADSSTSAAFCCVTPSICVTARPTCSIPESCSREAAAISATISVTCLTELTISSMVLLASSTSFVPPSTFSAELWISALISFAAVALRCARLRTSEATTAKPRPCSPARAASTAALRARILVWNAIASMTPRMSAILRDASAMPAIVVLTAPIARPPWLATLDAPIASS